MKIKIRGHAHLNAHFLTRLRAFELTNSSTH